MNVPMKNFAAAILSAAVLTSFAGPAFAANVSAEEQTAALASQISEKLDSTERWAVEAGFPRSYVIAEIAKAVLVTVDGAQMPGPVEAAALDKVAAANLSTQAQAAIKIVRRQTADD